MRTVCPRVPEAQFMIMKGSSLNMTECAATDCLNVVEGPLEFGIKSESVTGD